MFEVLKGKTYNQEYSTYQSYDSDLKERFRVPPDLPLEKPVCRSGSIS